MIAPAAMGWADWGALVASLLLLAALFVVGHSLLRGPGND